MLVAARLDAEPLPRRMKPAQSRKARLALNWCAAKLAEAAGVELNTVKRFEAGSNAQASTIFKMQCVLERAGIDFASGPPRVSMEAIVQGKPEHRTELMALAKSLGSSNEAIGQQFGISGNRAGKILLAHHYSSAPVGLGARSIRLIHRILGLPPHRRITPAVLAAKLKFSDIEFAPMKLRTEILAYVRLHRRELPGTPES